MANQENLLVLQLKSCNALNNSGKKVMFKQTVKIVSYSMLFLMLLNNEALSSTQYLTKMSSSEEAPFFDYATATYSPLRGSAVIARPKFLDLQPSIMYEPDLNDNYPFKIWWFCGAPAKNPDISCTSNIGCAPADLDTTDRICFNESVDGDNFVAANAKIVIAPNTAVDDHLVGSPTVLKINGEYIMFYESYLNWVSTVNRFFSATRGDNWITNGIAGAGNNLHDWEASYNFERHLGFAPLYKKINTRAIYSCQINYDRYLSKKPCPVGNELNAGEPIFWFYKTMATGRKPLYACWDPAHFNSFVTDQPNCEGFVKDTRNHLLNNYELGYVATDLSSPDMKGALQNRIMMATSKDGKTWTTFKGNASGEAVITPQEEDASKVHKYPPQPGCSFVNTGGKYDITRTYGSGLPIALVRDGFLELYFNDDSKKGWKEATDPITNIKCKIPPFPDLWRVRVAINKIKDATAYSGQRQKLSVGDISDIKWSSTLKRYFAVKHNKVIRDGDVPYESPQIVWSSISIDANTPPNFKGPLNKFREMTDDPVSSPLTREKKIRPLFPIEVNVPTTFGEHGGIMGDANGTLDFEHAVANKYLAIHLYYNTVLNGDLEHNLIFFWKTKSP